MTSTVAVRGLGGKNMALAAGAIGLALCAVGWITAPREFFVGYLFAEVFFVGLSLGSLGILMTTI